MAESAESLFRRGMISQRQAGKLGVLKGTKVNPAWGAGEASAAGGGAEFNSKRGRNDQGGRRDRGDAIALVGHIDARSNVNAGNPGRASGMPSRGGTVASGDGNADLHYDEIDRGNRQRPNFPRGAGRLGGNAQPGFVPTKSPNRTRGINAAEHGANDRGPDNRTPKRARGGNPRSSGPQYGGPSSRANG